MLAGMSQIKVIFRGISYMRRQADIFCLLILFILLFSNYTSTCDPYQIANACCLGLDLKKSNKQLEALVKKDPNFTFLEREKGVVPGLNIPTDKSYYTFKKHDLITEFTRGMIEFDYADPKAPEMSLTMHFEFSTEEKKDHYYNYFIEYFTKDCYKPEEFDDSYDPNSKSFNSDKINVTIRRSCYGMQKQHLFITIGRTK
jgi:D-alanyl-lipoteichoic acid acyltransferase DltB (MBOAT superfamily)